MVNRRRTRRPNGSVEVPVRSVRVADDLWEKARRRATYEGVTMSQVLYDFVDGYARGLVDRPRVEVVFTPTRQASSAAAEPVG